MKHSTLSSCYIGPEISPEQFISEHFFLYLIAGTMTVYDGNKEYKIKAGDAGIARKNHLAKYNKQPDNGKFEKVAVIFEQEFLQLFHQQHQYPLTAANPEGAIFKLEKSHLIENYIQSLAPYINEGGKIEEGFSFVKRSELLLILLKQNPDLANLFFDFGIPAKINLEEFMNRNYKFNVSLERFAYLTGRSLSAFKRDFDKTFGQTPSHWLVQKRLKEAYFQIEKKGKRPTDIYLDLGFEDLSHFSFAFKKQFGMAPTAVTLHK